jgi:hypothetical protein
MANAVATLHYFNTDIQVDELPLLDNEFDLYCDPDFSTHAAVGDWDAFMTRYTGNKGAHNG